MLLTYTIQSFKNQVPIDNNLLGRARLAR